MQWKVKGKKLQYPSFNEAASVLPIQEKEPFN